MNRKTFGFERIIQGVPFVTQPNGDAWFKVQNPDVLCIIFTLKVKNEKLPPGLIVTE